MSWLASVGVGFLTAIIGAFGTGGLGLLCVEWYRVPSREGGSAYMVLFMGLLGGVLGFIIGVIASRVIASGNTPGFLKGLSLAAGSCLGLLVIATVICWLAADLDTKVNGRPVELLAEMRCPAGFVLPEEIKDERWYVCVGTATRRATSYGELHLKEAKLVDGRWVLSTKLVLKTSVREKEICFSLGEKPQWFRVAFPSKPGPVYFNWSEWQQGIEEVGKPKPFATEGFNLRYRLELVPEPKPELPGPTAEEIQTQKDAEENAVRAAVDSLTPESPLEDCLKFTHYSQSEERRKQVGAIIGRRANVVEEMSAQILSSDPEISDRALRTIAYLRPLRAELAGPVAAVGEKLIIRLEQFNASKPEDDPRFQAAADASVVFSAWFQAHHALHEHAGVNGLPQLKRILELSQQRPDSSVMKNDVARIALYYVTEWNATPVAGK